MIVITLVKIPNADWNDDDDKYKMKIKPKI